MFKIYLFSLFIFFLAACSVDTKTGFWENKLTKTSETQLSELSFDEKLSFEEYKKNVIAYGKKSNFPNLMD